MADTLEERSTGQQADLAGIVAKLKTRAPEIRKVGATSLVLFGSRTHSDARLDSDLDVLIEYDPSQPFTLYDLLDVKSLLEDLTGLPVHVTTRDGFEPERLRRVLKKAVTVF